MIHTESVERKTLTVAEVADVLGISRSLTYRLIRAGKIPAISLGRRVVVPAVALETFLAEAVHPLLTLTTEVA